MLVSWLRGRRGGVFAMIAPSVQGIAWDIIGLCKLCRNTVDTRRQIDRSHYEWHATCYREPSAETTNPTRGSRRYAGGGVQGSADDALTFPASSV